MVLCGVAYRLYRQPGISFHKTLGWFLFFSAFASVYFLAEGLSFYYPWYFLSTLALGGVFLTGAGLAYALYREIPGLLSWTPGPVLEAQLRKKNDELEETNAKLKKQQQQLEALLESNPDAIAKLDREFRHLYVNQSVLRTSGAPPEFFIGKTIEEVNIPLDFLLDYRENLNRVLETGEIVKFESVRGERLAGGRDAYVLTLVPIFNEQKEIDAILVTSRDITERKLAEQRLEDQVMELKEMGKHLTEKNRQLEDFTHIVSHNLRSPVRNLRLLLEFYSQEQRAEGREELVKKIEDVSQQLTNTLADLTEVIQSRPSSEVLREHLKLENVAKGLLESLSGQIKEAKASLEYNFDALPEVVYPKIYLESALLNFITNSLKYRSPERSLKVEIWSWLKEGQIGFSVEDNGLGIDLELHGQRLFGLNNTFHDHEDSRGMGLFITRNQVEALGGSIAVESEVGKGTIFHVTLGQALAVPIR